MTSEARERMIDSAAVLLAQHGYQATSFGAVLDRSQAPRGSIYHHFPDGKDELVAAAVDVAGGRAIALMDTLDGRSALEIVDGFMGMWRAVLVRSQFTAGCAVLAVTTSGTPAELQERAGHVFHTWGDRVSRLLQTSGIEPERADGLATMLIAASEGAVVLCRAHHSLGPLDVVQAQLRRLVAGPDAGLGR